MIYVVVAVIAGVTGFFLGKFYSIDVDELEEMTEGLESTTEVLEDFTQQIDAFNSDDERHLKEAHRQTV